ncbi:hypothetical protein BJV78DRAFT_1158147 [Lactifluus subvellereus]|nr:hypothetical protein BJV78DRAFT_1158147 [Lactifluus subvellereus]
MGCAPSKPATRPSPKPGTRPSPKPDARPSPKPDTRPSPKPDTRPSPKPDARPSPKPDKRPSPKPDAHSSKLDTHTSSKLDTHSSSRSGLPDPPPDGSRAGSGSNTTHPAGGPKFENPSVRTNPESVPNGDRGGFTSTVRSVLPDNFRFRILVVGKVFVTERLRQVITHQLYLQSGYCAVTMSLGTKKAASGNADINIGFPYPDNGRLIVHECPGFEPGSAQNFPAIREFITRRTNTDLPQSEKLHAIWVCVPTLDLIDGTLGDGVEEILSMQKVPVVLVFTKFDLLVSKVLFDIAGGDSQQHERAKVEAERKYEELCHLRLRKKPRDVPVEIVSTNPGLSDLISKLFATTHRLVVADSVNASVVSTLSEAQGEKVQNPPVSLAWSIAQRVSRDAKLRASIVVGQSRPSLNVGYWRSLGSSNEFSGRTLEEWAEVIRSDIVDVWNLRDHTKYLSSGEFKAQMSHLVKDLAEPLAGAPPSSNLDGIIEARSATPAAQWVKNPYQNTTENIRCIIGYIVDLTVIHNELFRSGRDVSVGDVLSVMDSHDKSGTRSRIHNEIRRIVTETAQMSYGTDNLILEKAIRLITQFCDSLSGSS